MKTITPVENEESIALNQMFNRAIQNQISMEIPLQEMFDQFTVFISQTDFKQFK